MATTPLSQAVLAGMDPNIYGSLQRMQTGQQLSEQGMDSSPTTKLGAVARLAQALSGSYVSNGATSDLAKTIAGGKKSYADSLAAQLAQSPGAVPSAARAVASIAQPAAAPNKIYSNDEPSPLDPPSGADRAKMVATILGEAGNEPQLGKDAVASVIRTRAVDGGYGGNTPSAVVTAPNQFEPWNTAEGRARMERAAADPKQAAAAEAAIASAYGEGGKAPNDPTEGMTHFYSPTAQAALGRNAPAWAGGESVKIGGHVFNSPDDPAAIPTAAQPAQGYVIPGQPAPQAGELDVNHLLALMQHPYADGASKALLSKLLVQKLTPAEIPAGFEKNPDGPGQRPIAGGVASPEYLRKKAEAISEDKPAWGIVGKDKYNQPIYGYPPTREEAAAQPKIAQQSDPTEGLQGKDLLTKLQQTNPSVASQVTAIIEGRAPYPTGSRLNPVQQQVKELVTQVDPTFETGNSGARVKVRNEFNAGGPNTPAGQITAGNTAIQHLAKLAGASDKIGGTNNGWIANSLLNKGNVAVEGMKNDPALVEYNNSLGRFAEEATKFYRGIGGSEADIKRALEDLTPGQSPEARKEAIRSQAELMHSKINALQDRWKQGMGPLVGDFPIVHQESKAAMDVINGRKSETESKPAPAALSNEDKPTGPFGHKIVSSKQEYEELPPGSTYIAPDGSVRTKK